MHTASLPSAILECGAMAMVAGVSIYLLMVGRILGKKDLQR